MARHEQPPAHSDYSPDAPPGRGEEHSSESTQEPHTIITPETELGGAIYPFLEEIGRNWHLVTRTLASPPLVPGPDTLNMEQPTLRWVNGQRIVEAFVDGVSTDEFFRASGLAVSLDKGGFVLSKRLSRIFRPYFIQRHFLEGEAVSVTYREAVTPSENKVWDGAGLISRRLLERLIIPLGVSPAKRRALERNLYHARRVEFTLLTEAGEDKGHAIVADQLPSDFVLPRDTKREVKLVDGTRFVGINLLHSHDTMRLDIQSLINLYPFFGVEQLATWLADEGGVFAEAVRSGTVAEAMRRVDTSETAAELERWPLREYFASGGQPLWFADVTRNLMNQHLTRLRAAMRSKLTLPIPGGRFYVMPIGVGHEAGVEFDVPRGCVRLDRGYATAWVNDDDWCQLDGAVVGIAELLGGADNDDALWVHEFTDYDSTSRVLCWRSPNQVGEYVVLIPTLGSAVLDFATPEGNVQFPPADSRILPSRKDMVHMTYQHLIDQTPAGGVRKGHPYSVAAMNETLRWARENAGALGMYCNLLMVAQAVFGRLPAHPPAPLEDVIDASVKTGADLSPVKAWCYEASQRLIKNHIPIPSLLAPRVLGAGDTPVTLTTTHWLDDLVAAIQDHISTFTTIRDEVITTAMPPAIVFDHAFNAGDVTLIEAGAELHRVYRNALRLRRGNSKQLSPDDYEAARMEAENYLARFAPEEQPALLRSAIVSTYLSDYPNDAVLWLPGARSEGGRLPGIAHKTIEALREIDLLLEIGDTEEGLLAYPGAAVSLPTYSHSIRITGVWFNWLCAWQAAHGQPVSQTPGEVSKPRSTWAKARIAELSQTQFRDLVLIVRADGERKVAFTQHGNFFGYISKDSTDQVPEGEIVLRFAICQDGNLRCVWSPVAT